MVTRLHSDCKERSGYAAMQSLHSHIATLFKISFGVDGFSAVKPKSHTLRSPFIFLIIVILRLLAFL